MCKRSQYLVSILIILLVFHGVNMMVVSMQNSILSPNRILIPIESQCMNGKYFIYDSGGRSTKVIHAGKHLSCDDRYGRVDIDYLEINR